MGEPVKSCQHGHSQLVRINGILVYRKADMEMVDLAGVRPVCILDYFTSMITPQYLELLREAFQILGDVELVVPSPNDLPSRPSLDHVTLSAQYLRADLHLPFHPFFEMGITKTDCCSHVAQC